MRKSIAVRPVLKSFLERVDRESARKCERVVEVGIVKALSGADGGRCKVSDRKVGQKAKEQQVQLVK